MPKEFWLGPEFSDVSGMHEAFAWKRVGYLHVREVDDNSISIFKDGDKWCALMGTDLQSGHAGFGNTKAEAIKNFATGLEPVKLDSDKNRAGRYKNCKCCIATQPGEKNKTGSEPVEK